MSTIKNLNPDLDLESRRYHLVNIISVATGFSYNRCDNEVGDLLDYCLKNNYNDRTTLGTCFARLWENYVLIRYLDDMKDE